jgi:hypothetical protein
LCKKMRSASSSSYYIFKSFGMLLVYIVLCWKMIPRGWHSEDAVYIVTLQNSTISLEAILWSKNTSLFFPICL